MSDDDMKDVEDKIYNVNLFRKFTTNLTSQNSKTHNNSKLKVDSL